MKIYAYFCGELDHQFTDTDDKQVEEMCRRLDDPDNDTRSYWLEGGRPILYWRRDGRIHGNIQSMKSGYTASAFQPWSGSMASRLQSSRGPIHIRTVSIGSTRRAPKRGKYMVFHISGGHGAIPG